MRHYSVFLLVTLLLVFGCKKDDPVSPDRPRTSLHILNGAEIDTFNLTFDYYNSDDKVIYDFYYQRNFPSLGYADMEAGGTPDEFGNGKLFMSLSRQPFANIAPDTIMQPIEMVLNADEKSTLCFADSFGTIQTLKIADVYSIPNDSTALVRFINLAAGMPIGSLKLDSTTSITNVAYLTNSDFISLPEGTYSVELQDTAGSTVSTASVNINGGTAFSFYMSGTSPNMGYFKH